MDSSQVIGLFRAFDRASLRVWAAGGWAVDAIVGRQTREHGDLDVAVDIRDLPRLLGLLREQGFAVTTDWMPSRLEMTASDGRAVDIHPVTFAEDGTGYQADRGGDGFTYAADGFATGTIDGEVVACLSVGQQLCFREGYEPRDVDEHDVALLETFR